MICTVLCVHAYLNFPLLLIYCCIANYQLHSVLLFDSGALPVQIFLQKRGVQPYFGLEWHQRCMWVLFSTFKQGPLSFVEVKVLRATLEWPLKSAHGIVCALYQVIKQCWGRCWKIYPSHATWFQPWCHARAVWRGRGWSEIMMSQSSWPSNGGVIFCRHKKSLLSGASEVTANNLGKCNPSADPFALLNIWAILFLHNYR